MRRALALTFIPVLVAGALLATPVAAESFLDRARDAVRDAGKKIEDAAKDAGRSVRDFLTDHPDLNRDIVDFGERIGVPGFAGAKPEPGPVVSAERAVSVTGTLSKEGVECPALRGDDGKLYTLIPGELGGFGPGDRVHVEGTAAEVSTCMQGTTIVVSAIAAAK